LLFYFWLCLAYLQLDNLLIRKETPIVHQSHSALALALFAQMRFGNMTAINDNIGFSLAKRTFEMGLFFFSQSRVN